MVRPRKEQILSINTRHARYTADVTAGTSLTTITAASVNPYLITDTQGGAQEDCPAFVRGTVSEIFTIVASDAINISVDGGSTITVTFAGTDTIASKVVARINGTVGIPANFARNENGKVLLVSTTTGSTSTIQLSDFVAGTLAKLGLTAGTTTGATAPIRGVVTKSADLKGGFVRLSRSEGNTIVTNADELISISNDIKFGHGLTANIKGGLPLHGRLLPSGSNYELSYFCKIPQRPEVVTGDSSFASLNGTDSFTITVSGPNGIFGPFTITFPAFPYTTAASIADRINTVFATTANTVTGTGNAFVDSVEVQPFDMEGGDTFYISIDGGVTTPVTFAGTEVTAADVVATINAALGVTGTASTYTDLLGNISFRIQSNNTNGRTSSVEIFGPPDNITKKLGLSVGKIRGFICADLYGTQSVKIFSPTRGALSSLVIGGVNPTTLTRMGLTAGTYPGSDSYVEESVNLPVVSGFASTYTLKCLIPEELEFGEVNPATESFLENFDDISAGNNNSYSDDLYASGAYPYFAAESGLGTQGGKDHGKVVLANHFGVLDEDLLVPAQTYANRFFKKFLRTASSGGYRRGEVAALVASSIETPGTSGNPLPTSNIFTVDVDPDNSYTDAEFRIQKDRLGTPVVPFRVRELGGASPTALDWVSDAGTGTIDFGYGSVLSRLWLYDVNTIAAGGAESIPFTDATQTDLRIGDALVTSGLSLLKKVNSVFTITCGDGVNSFGDFNGANAIQDAVAYIISTISSDTFRIQIKQGTYTVDTGAVNVTGTIDPTNSGAISNATFIFEAVGPNAVIIASSNATVFEGGISNRLELINLRIETFTAPYSRLTNIGQNSVCYATGCSIVGSQIRAVDSERVIFDKSTIDMSADAACDRPAFLFEFGDGAADTHQLFKFVNSKITSGQNNPILRVRATGAAVSYTVCESIVFEDCKLSTKSTTVDGNGNLTGNCGIFDVDPNGSIAVAGSTGVLINSLNFTRCDVQANTSLGPVSVLIHFIPTANGVFTNASPWTFGVSPYLAVNYLTIDGGDWVIPGVNTSINPFTIGGVAVKLTINNISYGTPQSTGVTQGAATADVGGFFTSLVGPSGAPATSFWGSMALSAFNLDLDNIKINEMTRAGNSGDLFVYCLQNCRMKDISITDYIDAAPGSVPNQRVRFRFGDPIAYNTLNANIKRLIIKGANGTGNWTATSTGDNDYAIIVYEPVQEVFGINKHAVTFENCEVSDFLNATIQNSIGFAFHDIAGGALFGTGLGVNGTMFTGVKLINNKFDQNTVGISYVNSNTVVRNLEIIDNKITNCSDWGVYLYDTTTDALGLLTINDNRIFNCGNTSGREGIYVNTADWDNTYLIMNHNYVHNNNTAVTGIQVNIINSAIPGSTSPRGVVMGNSARASTGFVGQFRIQTNNTPTLITGTYPAAFTPAGEPFRGVETGYVGGAAPGDSRYFQPATPMFHNDATLT